MVAARGLSLVAASGGYSLAVVRGFLIAAASFVLEHTVYGWQASVAAEHRFNS